MNSILALGVVFLIYAIGDIVASKTKAFISTLLACSLIFTISFWLGMPKSLFKDSGLLDFAQITLCMFLIHIGSDIKVRDFIKEWKTVIVTLIATICVSMAVYFIGQFLIDKYLALMGAPVLAGGAVAFLVMSPISDILGRPELKVFAVLILVFHTFVGIPIASFFCKKEGNRIREKYVSDQTITLSETTEDNKKRLFTIPEKYSTSNLILCKLCFISYISVLLSQLTGMSFLIFGMLFGVLFHEIGLLEADCLIKANGFSFVIAGAIAIVFVSLTEVTPQMLLSMIVPLITVFAIGTIVCCTVAVLVGRIVHFSWQMSIAMAITAFFGFPGTYLVSTEVSNSCGHTEEERKFLLNYFLPKLVIAGIISVSIVSGVVASIMFSWV